LVQEIQDRRVAYRTIPAGHVIDWHDPTAVHHLNVETGEFTLFVDGPGVLNAIIVAIEVQPPPDAEAPASIQWAIAATRRLRAESRIPEGATQADLARLLEAEAKNAVKAGKLHRELKASYLENQLGPWGIWPLDTFR
jgi:hypothetical protein